MTDTQMRGPGRSTLGWMGIAGVAALAVGLVAGPALGAVNSPGPGTLPQ